MFNPNKTYAISGVMLNNFFDLLYKLVNASTCADKDIMKDTLTSLFLELSGEDDDPTYPHDRREEKEGDK